MRTPDASLVLLQQADGSWQELCDPAGVITAHTPSEVLPALRELESASRRGLFAAGFLAYEAAAAFDPHLAVHPSPGRPLLWFQLGRRFSPYVPAPVRPPAPITWTPSISAADYHRAVDRVRAWIASGDTYQVNLTFRQYAEAPAAGDPPWLHLPLAQPQGVGAYFATPDFVLASASPELFFKRDGARVTCRPMKGTAPRGRWPGEDEARRTALQGSAKNRAENLMITDMVRNDLGRVARPGSVTVHELFAAERYPTVWQLTSTVTAETGAPLVDLLSALFPSASVTGAPKVRTMQIIRDLETTPRGVYTGAVGWLGPGEQARFNVAIRTVWQDRRSGRAEYGTGSGVVWDSSAASEFEECRDKTRVLDWTAPAFELLETLAWRPEAGFARREEHLDRLQASARYFDFPCDRTAVAAALEQAASTWSSAHRVRLLLDRHGVARVEARDLPSPPAAPARVGWATTPVRSDDIRLYHKTTDRRIYEQARAAAPQADDVLLWNERGELCEATIANVAVRIGDDWFTPPVECGLLPGVERRALLESGRLRERVIRRAEVTRDTELAIFNSVRGWWPARLAG
jgi:para-aminobenzoate synthetase/4-amino-4-deoxychorismate lyase